MKVRVLGCSGGIGGRSLRTTSLLVDDDLLIDAGTGVGDLAIDELARIEQWQDAGLPALLIVLCGLVPVLALAQEGK